MPCENQSPGAFPSMCGIRSTHSWGDPLDNPINPLSYLGTSSAIIVQTDSNNIKIKDPYNNWRQYYKFYDPLDPSTIGRKKIRFLSCTRHYTGSDFNLTIEVDSEIDTADSSYLIIKHNGAISTSLLTFWLTSSPAIRLTHSLESYQSTCLTFGYSIQGSNTVIPCCSPETDNPIDPDNPGSGGCTQILTKTLTTTPCQFTSSISQADANNKALAYLESIKQTELDLLVCNQVCVTMTDSKVKNDCPAGETGTEPPSPYSTTRCAKTKAEAESLAYSDIVTYSQSWANTYGTCTSACSKYTIAACNPGTLNNQNLDLAGILQTYPRMYYPHKSIFGTNVGGTNVGYNTNTLDKVWYKCLAKPGTLQISFQVGHTYSGGIAILQPGAVNLVYKLDLYFYDPITDTTDSTPFHTETRGSYYNEPQTYFPITVPTSSYTSPALAFKISVINPPAGPFISGEIQKPFSSYLQFKREDCC